MFFYLILLSEPLKAQVPILESELYLVFFFRRRPKSPCSKLSPPPKQPLDLELEVALSAISFIDALLLISPQVAPEFEGKKSRPGILT
jgi:hypothetical protein